MDGAIIDINQCAVIDVLKLYKYYNTDTFEKIIFLARLDINKINRVRAAEVDKIKSKKHK